MGSGVSRRIHLQLLTRHLLYQSFLGGSADETMIRLKGKKEASCHSNVNRVVFFCKQHSIIIASPLERDLVSSAVASVRWVDQTNPVVHPDGRAVRSPQPQTPHAAVQHRNGAAHARSVRYRSLCVR